MTEQEKLILDKAAEVFQERGYDGTSLGEIARRSGCNQALVHYYYRSKELLFRRIFIERIERTLSYLTETVGGDGLSFVERVDHFVDVYFDFLKANPTLPFLIMNELVLNPERRAFVREHFFLNPALQQVYARYKELLAEEKEAGRIRRDVDAFDLLQSIISETVFAFISLPVYDDLLDNDAHKRDELIERRRRSIKRGVRVVLGSREQ